MITFPYVSRILGAENLGKYNFSYSVISYFVLIAGLGINSYGVRQGAKIREDRETFSNFFSNIFTINIYSTILSYILLIITIVFVPKLHNYAVLLAVFSLQIVLTTIGVEWVFSVYEEYEYITIRTIAVKIVLLVLLFVFVKDKDDVVNYTVISVISFAGANIFNAFNVKKYCDFTWKSITAIKIHLKPILILFASSVAVLIYVYSDTTMLGFLCSDFEVGLYSLSSKIYIILKNVLSAIIIVSIPRLSNLYGNDKIDDFKATVQSVIDNIAFLLLPCVFGIMLLSEDIVLLVGGNEYQKASTSLFILGIALLCCLYGWIFNQCVLLPTNNEKIISISTGITALFNIIANFLLIPCYGHNAAAFTTLLAELIMLVICGLYAKKYGNFKIINLNFFKILLGCLSFGVPIILLKNLMTGSSAMTIIAIGASAIVYFIVEFLLKNVILVRSIKQVKRLVQIVKR